MNCISVPYLYPSIRFWKEKCYQICRLAEDKYPLKIKDLSGEVLVSIIKYLKKGCLALILTN